MVTKLISFRREIVYYTTVQTWYHSDKNYKKRIGTSFLGGWWGGGGGVPSKPSKLLTGEDSEGKVCLTDLGIARTCHIQTAHIFYTKCLFLNNQRTGTVSFSLHVVFCLNFWRLIG